jgi:O-antigen/teichoic acid export membrane protein
MRDRRFFLRAAGSVVGQAGQAGSLLVLTVAVTRVAPPSVRGEFVLLTSLAQIGTYVVALGLPAAVLNAAASGRFLLRELASVAAVSAVVVGTVLTAVAFPLLRAAGATRPPLTMLFIGNASVAWLIFAGWFYFGTQRFLRGGIIRTLPIAGAAVAVVLAAHLGHSGSSALFAAWVVPSALVGAGVAVALARETGFGYIQLSHVRELWAYGLRFSGGQIAQLGAQRLDQWLVAVMVSTAAVGIYSIAAAASESVLLVATAMGIVVFSDTAQGSSPASFRRQTRTCLIAVLASGSVLALVARSAVPFIFGARYAAAATPLLILLCGAPGLVVLRMVTNRLAGLGAPGGASVCSLAALIATSGLDVALIPNMGINGAALASAIGYTVGGASAILALRRTTRRRPPVAAFAHA